MVVVGQSEQRPAGGRRLTRRLPSPQETLRPFLFLYLRLSRAFFEGDLHQTASSPRRETLKAAWSLGKLSPPGSLLVSLSSSPLPAPYPQFLRSSRSSFKPLLGALAHDGCRRITHVGSIESYLGQTPWPCPSSVQFWPASGRLDPSGPSWRQALWSFGTRGLGWC